MKRLFLLAALTVSLAGAQAAEGHFYSYNSGQNDARWGVISVCGAGSWWICEARVAEVRIQHCYYHSWCWAGWQRTHTERHYLGWRKTFTTHGQAQHGTTVRNREECVANC